MPVLTVRSLAGEECWGPTEVALDSTVEQLRREIAKAIQKPASSLRLLKGTEVLSEGCIEAFCTEDSDLTLQLIGPGGYAEECMNFLDACPAIDTAEHKEWLSQAQASLLPTLGLLQDFDDIELTSAEQVKALCLRLLGQERTDFYGSPTERYPDEASVIAIQILRRIASRGEPGVTTVLKYWLQKIVYKDFDVQENTTSVQTVFHAAKAVPDLVQPGDTEVVEILRGKVFDLLNHYCESNDGPIYMCVEAASSILTESQVEETKRLLKELVGYGYSEMFHNSTPGRACLVLACRLARTAGESDSDELKAVLREALENGVQASADDAIEPASWETTYGMREAD